MNHTSSKLVSVIVRTKDRTDCLSKAIKSVADQSFPNIELVVVNDGGENIADILADNKKGAIRELKYLNFEKNQGRVNAANAGLQAAKGDFLIFLDDDDWFGNTHIEGLANSLSDEQEVSIVYSSVTCVELIDDKWVEHSIFDYPFDPVRLLVENYIPIHSALFSRSILDAGCRFDTEFDRLEDWDFWLQASAVSDFKHVKQNTAFYRKSQDSGFGVKQDQVEDNRFRMAIYRKWSGRWNDESLLSLMDRARSYPELEHLSELCSQRAEHIDGYKRELKRLTADYDTARQGFEEARQGYNLEIKRLNGELNNAHDKIRHYAQLTSTLEQRLTTQEQYRHRLADELELVYGSRSWKLTMPLRAPAKAREIVKTKGLKALTNPGHWETPSTLAQIEKDESTLSTNNTEQVATEYTALCFPVVENPEVSIVIPVYNKHLYTFSCLKAILENTHLVSYEVIVVDDRSTDETAEMLEFVTGIKVIRNETNSGFIYSCNAGAQAAIGDFLVLLNNDTLPQEGWLTSLLKTFVDFPDAGLVGSKLIYPNGVLQEAGGIAWNDGSAWNYGRNDRPDKPEYSYVRKVDYCSGACLMIRRTDFLEMGMFDSRYAPAYYEDTDLAFTVRANGKNVYYQPGCKIIHFEGISSGTDTGSGIKRFQEVNAIKFFEKWQSELAKQHPPGTPSILERERSVEKRALVIDARMLRPDNDSGSLRMANILKILQKLQYKVTFIPDNLEYSQKYTSQMQSLGIEVFYVPHTTSIEEHLRNFGNLYDLVILSRVDVASRHIEAIRNHCCNAKIIFDTVDLHFLREMREAEAGVAESSSETLQLRKELELDVARKADLTLVVSSAEIDLLAKEAPDINVALLSNIHILRKSAKGFQQRKDILFIGGFEHPPNIDAVDYFLADIFPLIRNRIPDIHFYIVGGKVPSHINAIDDDQITVTGFVSDIQPLFDNIRLSVAPLRYGAGVKGKINSSMNFGVPVIATTMAVEGMHLVDGKDVLVADDPEEFAEKIVQAYLERGLWEQLSAAGRRNIEKYFSFEVAENQLQEITESLSLDNREERCD